MSTKGTRQDRSNSSSKTSHAPPRLSHDEDQTAPEIHRSVALHKTVPKLEAIRALIKGMAAAPTAHTMETKVLPVKLSSIRFEPGASVPTVDDPETLANLQEAARILTTTDDAIGFPTETVYGLGASSLSDASVRSIYRAKNRPADNPLITHVSSLDQLHRKVLVHGEQIPEIYAPLIAKFWPGPLSILLPLSADSPISKLTTAEQPTFAVRMPSHPVARALIALSDTPLAAPSANASTRPSPTLAQHVYHDLHGRIPLVLDGGPCDVGVESTVVDGLCDPPMLLRPGGVSLEEIRQYGGARWADVVIAKKTAGSTEAVRTPGMKYRHYSPTAKVVTFNGCGDGVNAVQAYMAQHGLSSATNRIALLKTFHFRDQPGFIVKELGSTPAEVSANLFKLLREADEVDRVDYIFVEAIGVCDEGLAVMNRLLKASSEVVGDQDVLK